MAFSTHDPYEFARIYPKGIEARKALSSVTRDETISPWHKSFIQVVSNSESDDSGIDEGSPGRPKAPPLHLQKAFYTLSLAHPVEHFAGGWRAGRGSSSTPTSSNDTSDRSVDLLLIRPGQDAERVAPIHAIIKFNPHSGALLLVGAADGRHVRYTLHDSNRPLLLNNREQHVLYQSTNNFDVGNLSYSLTFTSFDTEQYANFVDKRNEILGRYGFPAPHPYLSAVWRPQDTKCGRVILHASFAAGAFGWHWVENVHQKDTALKEIEVGELCNRLQGLMPINGAWCEHDFDRICSNKPHVVYTSSPLAMHDFSKLDFSCPSPDRPSTQELIEFIKGPLEGLAGLHKSGYMHRDVSAKNILVLSRRPPRAVLGDFGKAVRATRHTDRQIGPVQTLAPEVDGFRVYDNKIDIWSLGVIWMCAFSPVLNHNFRYLPCDAWHSLAMEWFIKKQKIEGLDGMVAHLLQHMLAIDPQKRPSAPKALSHNCFKQQGPPGIAQPLNGHSGLAEAHDYQNEGSQRQGVGERRSRVNLGANDRSIARQAQIQHDSPSLRPQVTEHHRQHYQQEYQQRTQVPVPQSHFSAPRPLQESPLPRAQPSTPRPPQQSPLQQSQFPAPRPPQPSQFEPPQSEPPPFLPQRLSYANPFNGPRFHQRSWYVNPDEFSPPTAESADFTSPTGQSMLDWHGRQWEARHPPPPPPPPGTGGGRLRLK